MYCLQCLRENLFNQSFPFVARIQMSTPFSNEIKRLMLCGIRVIGVFFSYDPEEFASYVKFFNSNFSACIMMRRHFKQPCMKIQSYFELGKSMVKSLSLIKFKGLYLLYEIVMGLQRDYRKLLKSSNPKDFSNYYRIEYTFNKAGKYG